MKGISAELGARRIKAPALARRPLPSEGLGQGGTTRKKRVKDTLKMQLGLLRLLRLFPNNKGTRRGGVSRTPSGPKHSPSFQKARAVVS